MHQQIIVFAVIGITLLLFIDGRIRYEFVSLLGLIVLAITGIISPEKAFSGFSHPAIITVASVLVISSALIKSGVVDKLVILLNRGPEYISFKIMSLMTVTAILSAFMNNVGALALIMPIAIRVAKDGKISPSRFLMPVAFASLLGGMITAIGTPPNLILSNYRTQIGSQSFAFFDFAPVGITITAIGIIFTTIFGWRLIPKRKSQDGEISFNIEDYLSEVVVTENCKMVGKTLKDFYEIYKLEVNVLSIIRNKQKIVAPNGDEQLLVGDVLLIKSISS